MYVESLMFKSLTRCPEIKTRAERGFALEALGHDSKIFKEVHKMHKQKVLKKLCPSLLDKR